MELKKEETNRGFYLIHFQDDDGVECTLQESSAVEPHIWLGVQKPEILIMYKDAKKHGLNLKKKYPETNDWGWCNFPIPEEALIESRMHLNPEQALNIGKKLIEFAHKGTL